MELTIFDVLYFNYLNSTCYKDRLPTASSLHDHPAYLLSLALNALLKTFIRYFTTFRLELIISASLSSVIQANAANAVRWSSLSFDVRYGCRASVKFSFLKCEMLDSTREIL